MKKNINIKELFGIEDISPQYTQEDKEQIHALCRRVYEGEFGKGKLFLVFNREAEEDGMFEMHRLLRIVTKDSRLWQKIWFDECLCHGARDISENWFFLKNSNWSTTGLWKAMSEVELTMKNTTMEEVQELANLLLEEWGYSLKEVVGAAPKWFKFRPKMGKKILLADLDRKLYAEFLEGSRVRIFIELQNDVAGVYETAEMWEWLPSLRYVDDLKSIKPIG